MKRLSKKSPASERCSFRSAAGLLQHKNNSLYLPITFSSQTGAESRLKQATARLLCELPGKNCTNDQCVKSGSIKSKKVIIKRKKTCAFLILMHFGSLGLTIQSRHSKVRLDLAHFKISIEIFKK